MITTRLQKTLAVLAVSITLMGCGPGSNLGILLNIGGGLFPTIDWPASDGNAAGLAVSEYPGTSVNMWVLAVEGGAGIAPGVVYGTVPTGAYQTKGAAKPLVAGKQYDVTITTLAGRSGNAQFTP